MPTRGIDPEDQKMLALWGADCAERVLPLFEKKNRKDRRARDAIAAARAWARGEVRAGVARAAALDAHAAARATDDEAARAAARAAGHAAATAHVATHAAGAAAYARKALGGAGAKELSWQKRRVPRQLWTLAFPERVMAIGRGRPTTSAGSAARQARRRPRARTT